MIKTSARLAKGLGNNQVEITVTGSGFSFLIGEDGKHLRPLSGKVTELALSIGGDVWMTITDLTTELPDFDHLMLGWTWFELIDFAPSGQQMLSVLMSGNDRIMGSALDDVLIHGLNAGDDMIFGGDGADVITIAGLRGTDTIIGGRGFDVVAYDGDYEFGGVLGVTVDLANRRATDGWGSIDILQGIEGAIGTERDDVFIGDRGNNLFNGGMGVDRFNGGAGRGGAGAMRFPSIAV